MSPPWRLITLILVIALTTGLIVMIVLFAGSQKRVRHLKHEKFQLLSQVSSLTTGKSPDSVRDEQSLYRRDFVSHKDGNRDSYVLSPPLVPPPDGKYVLVVYLHGMGSNYLEPYFVPDKEPIAPRLREAFPGIVLASLSYGKDSSWTNHKAIADINQNISELTYAYPVDSIVMMGTSMGGCAAVYYSAVAPEPIRRRIRGVVSIEGAGDLAGLFRSTGSTVVKFGISGAMGGTPEAVPDIYRQASFLSHLAELPQSTRFAIVSARQDTTVPPALQKELKERIEEHGNPVSYVELDAGHEMPPPGVYVDALRFVLQ